jgi:heme/copper-type cytochrome/quinol oxidase subunit 3
MASIVFSLLTFLVAVPSAIKVFNWIATLYRGSIRVKPPFLYALGFVVLFSIGGLTGLIHGALATDVQVHDTYFVVGHFHYIIFGGMGFGLFAAFHYWFPKMFGRMYDRRLATVAWFILFVGFNMFYSTFLLLGWEGMPRRYYDFLAPAFAAVRLHRRLDHGCRSSDDVRKPHPRLLQGGESSGQPLGRNHPGMADSLAAAGGKLRADTDCEPGTLRVRRERREGQVGGRMAGREESFKSRMGMWLFILSEILLFGGLFLLYAVYRYKFPQEFASAASALSVAHGAFNTAVLISSSFTVALAVHFLLLYQPKPVVDLLTGSVSLGIIFLVVKGSEWADKFAEGVYPNSSSLLDRPSGEVLYYGLYFMMTGLHALHVLVGICLLSVLAVLTVKGKINSERPAVLINAGLYWHLVDVIWIFLFPLFYLIA